MLKEKRLNGFGAALMILVCSCGLYLLSELVLIPYNVSLRHKTQNLSAQIEHLRSEEHTSELQSRI